MTHHPSAASLRLHGARLLFPPVATLLFLVLTEYIARGALSGDTFVQYIFPHAEAYLLAWGLLFLVWMAVDWLTRFAPLATLLSGRRRFRLHSHERHFHHGRPDISGNGPVLPGGAPSHQRGYFRLPCGFLRPDENYQEAGRLH